MVIGKQVEDVMTKDVVAAGPGTPVLDIVRTILDGRLSGLPVIDDHHRVVGVVSEADLLLIAEYRDSRPPRRLESGHRRGERAKSSGICSSRSDDLPCYHDASFIGTTLQGNVAYEVGEVAVEGRNGKERVQTKCSAFAPAPAG
jgi:hypothetical protein